MTLSPAFLDELRARTQLSSLLSRSLKLTRAGRRVSYGSRKPIGGRRQVPQ